MTAPRPRRRVLVRKDQSGASDPFPWHFTVEWEPAEGDAMDYGSLATQQEALACALESLSCEAEFLAERERMADWHAKPLRT